MSQLEKISKMALFQFKIQVIVSQLKKICMLHACSMHVAHTMLVQHICIASCIYTKNPAPYHSFELQHDAGFKQV